MSRNDTQPCIRCRTARRNSGNKLAYPSVPFAFMYCNHCVRVRVAERAADPTINPAVFVAQAVQS